MNVTEVFIRRPVMTITLMAAMVFFGIIGYLSLPVSQLPQVEYPTISVNAGLPGADPETVAASVAIPLEREFSAISGLRSMNSRSSLGTTVINLQFELSRNIDLAAMDVQAAISRASGDLPSTMPSPPVYKKINPTEASIFYLIMTSDVMPLYEVTKYARTFVINSLSTISGVAQIDDYSQQKLTVRVMINPRILASREISMKEVREAIISENVNLPLGTLDGKNRTWTVKADGQLMDAKSYDSIIVSQVDGQPVRLDQLGSAINDVLNDKTTCYFNGRPCIALAVNRQPGSNTVAIVDRIKEKLPAIRASLPPIINLEIMYDRSEPIRKSIDDVKATLLLAVMLVVVVVFIFLRSIAATVVASIAIPLSIVFTFALMHLWRFSLDNLSLMALVLAVGFVIDDAVVVLENVVRHIQMGKKPIQAAMDGSKQIVFTVVSMTASLAVVFLPIMFMAGIYGRILNEFAWTIVMAILVSGMVAICISPMLSSRLLPSGGKITETTPFFRAMLGAYKWSLELAMRFRLITLLLAGAILAATIHLFIHIPKGFVPDVDMNFVFGISVGEQGASPEAMDRSMRQVGNIVARNENVKSLLVVSGVPQPNLGRMVPVLKDRPPRKESAEMVIRELSPAVDRVPGLKTFFQIPPMIQASTQYSASPYHFVMQSANTGELFKRADEFRAALEKIPLITGVSSDLYTSSPQAFVSINRDKAAMFGVRVGAIEDTLFSAYGERQICDIYGSDDTYKVILEVDKKSQDDMDRLSHLYVKGTGQAPIRLDAMAAMSPRLGPLTVNHYNQIPAVTVSFNTSPGYSLGQAIDSIKSLAEKTLPPSIQYRFGGTADAFEESLRSVIILLIVAVVVIYLILAILYESLVIPLTIVSGLPSAAFGGLVVLWACGFPLDLFGFVGIFMLIGIVKKNAIMVVDFALEAETKEGKTPEEAAIQGCLTRFRPIMMTTIAAIAGMVPIAIGYGTGGEARQPLGLAVVGGLLLSQVVTLYLTPVVYVLLASLQEWIRARKWLERSV